MIRSLLIVHTLLLWFSVFVHGAVAQTQAPMLTKPSSSTTVSTTLDLQYTLKQVPLAGSVVLTFRLNGSVSDAARLTLDNSINNSFSIDPKSSITPFAVVSQSG